MTALLHALANLARLRWRGATFRALVMLCATTHASAVAAAIAHARINVSARADNATTASATAPSGRGEVRDEFADHVLSAECDTQGVCCNLGPQ